MTRKIHKSNQADLACAPTGCAASLIDGSTTCRSFSIPTGKKYKKAPENRAVTNVSQYRAAQIAFASIITQNHDESSMNGRSDFAFIKHRNEEYRRKDEILPEEDSLLTRMLMLMCYQIKSCYLQMSMKGPMVVFPSSTLWVIRTSYHQ